jgi:hypothetical protein
MIPLRELSSAADRHAIARRKFWSLRVRVPVSREQRARNGVQTSQLPCQTTRQGRGWFDNI